MRTFKYYLQKSTLIDTIEQMIEYLSVHNLDSHLEDATTAPQLVISIPEDFNSCDIQMVINHLEIIEK